MGFYEVETRVLSDRLAGSAGAGAAPSDRALREVEAHFSDLCLQRWGLDINGDPRVRVMVMDGQAQRLPWVRPIAAKPLMDESDADRGVRLRRNVDRLRRAADAYQAELECALQELSELDRVNARSAQAVERHVVYFSPIVSKKVYGQVPPRAYALFASRDQAESCKAPEGHLRVATWRMRVSEDVRSSVGLEAILAALDGRVVAEEELRGVVVMQPIDEVLPDSGRALDGRPDGEPVYARREPKSARHQGR